MSRGTFVEAFKVVDRTFKVINSARRYIGKYSYRDKFTKPV